MDLLSQLRHRGPAYQQGERRTAYLMNFPGSTCINGADVKKDPVAFGTQVVHWHTQVGHRARVRARPSFDTKAYGSEMTC